MASTTASIAAENKFRERKSYRRLVQFCEIEVLTRFAQKQLFLPRLKRGKFVSPPINTSQVILRKISSTSYAIDNASVTLH